MSEDYYKVLGLERNSTKQDIKKAYRKMAMKYHPDRNPGSEKWANDKFKEVNEAFGVLGDPEKRRQYDRFGTAGTADDMFRSTYTQSTFEDLMKDFNGAGLRFDFLDSIFEDFLGGSGFSFRKFSRGSAGQNGKGFGAPGRINLKDLFGHQQQTKPKEVRYEITITREQAAQGLEKDLTRKGIKLRVKIPAGIRTGNRVRLRNARQLTDREPGDITIMVKVK